MEWREEVVDWIYLVQDRDKVRPSGENTLADIWVPKPAGKFSSDS